MVGRGQGHSGMDALRPPGGARANPGRSPLLNGAPLGAPKSASPSNHRQALRWRETCDPNCDRRLHEAAGLAPVFAAVQHRSSFPADGSPMAMTAKIQKLTPRSSDEKDVPLREDIRLLGRILGDTVREQEGEEV